MTEVRPDEISAILRRQLAGFEKETDILEVGTVLQVGDGVARVYGLANCMSSELVEFSNNVLGMVLNLDLPQQTLSGGADLSTGAQILDWVGNPYPISLPIGNAGFNGSSVGDTPFVNSGTLVRFSANADITESAANTDGTSNGWRDLIVAPDPITPSTLVLKPGKGYVFLEPQLTSFGWSVSKPY